MPSSQTRKSIQNHRRVEPTLMDIPFWPSATAFYLCALLVAVGAFLVTRALLPETDEEFGAWFGSGAALLVVTMSVILREVVLRRERDRRRRLLRMFSEAYASIGGGAVSKGVHKISRKQNAELLRRIKKKSDAARELGEIAEGHIEVFELCNGYLALNKEQIENANPGSPRLGDLKQGREFVRRLHHFHLLAWAQIESRTLTAAAQECDKLSDKFSKAREALQILESALRHYPTDSALRDSELAVQEFLVSLQLRNIFEAAEQKASGGDSVGAVASLKQAYSFLDREGSRLPEKDLIKEKLEREILRFSVQAHGAKDDPQRSTQN